MFIITEKKTRTLLAMGSGLEYQQNGRPTLTDKRMTFLKTQVDVHEVEEVPDGVEVAAYCYSPDAGFYENPHFVEMDKRYGIAKSTVDTIIDDYTVSLIESGVL